jgi:hypothetical protein
MPDLTLVPMQQCHDLNREKSWNVGGYYQYRTGDLVCSCAGYKYHKKCKHITQITPCDWHELYGTPQTPEQRAQNICPDCGGETENVLVGV